MKKPNILIILADQQRYDTINQAGYDYMITPNLDRLAREGCIYKNAHTNNPVCQPARHDLLLGLPARAHGYYQNSGRPIKNYGLPTLPRIFAENGYRTAAIGKMHFTPTRMHHGYSEMYTMEEVVKIRQDDDYAMYLKENGLGDIQNIHGVRPHVYHIPQNSQVPEEHHEITWIKNKTIEWLEKNGDNPFMLCVGYIKPHPPWDIPERFKGIYKDKKLKEPVPISRGPLDPSKGDKWCGDCDTDEHKRKIREAYYTAITMVDESVGEIINYLEKTGKLDDTLIIYTSDHGEMLQDKGYYSKALAYEGSVRIPFIVRYPEKFKPNTVCEDFVDLLDIMPTCLDVAGLEYPKSKYELYGASLCDKNSKRDRSTIQASCGFLNERRWVMSRNKNYKYIYNYNNGVEEMYDMVNDPGEVENIIEKMKDTEVYIELKRKAIEYESKWGPEGAVVNNEFIKIDGNNFHGSVRGKYHYWCNNQFQKFYEKDKAGRGEQFIKEIQHALSDEEHSGIKLKDVFNEPSWIESFEKGFTQYAEFKEFKDILFKENI